MPLLLFAALFLTSAAHASDFYAGDGVACGQREGTVEKVFSRNSLLVRFAYSYYEGVPRNEEALSVERGDRCVRLLGEANGTGPAELTKGDTALCGFKEGTVMAAYTQNVAKVHFYASYEEAHYAPINETHLIDVTRCERQISPGR